MGRGALEKLLMGDAMLEVEDRGTQAYKLKLSLGEEIDEHKGKSHWANAKDISMSPALIKRIAAANPLLYEWDLKELPRSIKVIEASEQRGFLESTSTADFSCFESDGQDENTCEIKCDDPEGWCRNALRVCRNYASCIALMLSSDKSRATLKRTNEDPKAAPLVFAAHA
jgi:hypothetical protein